MKKVFLDCETVAAAASVYPWASIVQCPEAQYTPCMDEEEFASRYRQAIATVRAEGNEPVLVCLPEIDEYRYFATITGEMTMAEQRNLMKWLNGDLTRLCTPREQCNQVLRSLAETEGLALVG